MDDDELLLIKKGLLSLSVLVFSYFLFLFFFRGQDESAIVYSVPPPAELDSKHWQQYMGKDGLLNLDKLKKKSNGYLDASNNASNNSKIYCYCPADGRPIGDPIHSNREADIDRAITLANAAQSAWSTTTFSQRRRVLRTMLRFIIDHQEDIVTACCLDSGKTRVDACFGEILVTAEKLQWTIKHGERALAPSRRPTNLLMCYKDNSVIYEPLGVVAACVSWNYPFHNFISPVISALFAGNAIVVKPSEQTCWSSVYFTNIIQSALTACGHSPDLVQNVVCLPDVADHLTSHPGISHITFIGSREIAHKVCASAAKSLTPVTVELGGKDPAIILDDAKTVQKVSEICSILMRGVFQSAGQNCIGIERVIALPKIHDKIISTVLPLIQNMVLGSATLADPSKPAHFTPDMGSLISARGISHLESLIASAVADGATLHAGGHAFKHPTYPEGHYFAPTLLSNVTPSMAIAREELFAPVFLIMRANDLAAALKIANSTLYALGASVFGHSAAALRQSVAEVHAGMVAVNDFGAFYACSLPFGGVKGSGYGRFGGEEGLRALSNVKAVCKDAPWARILGIQTSIPPPLRYPIVDGDRAWQMCRGVVELGYELGLIGRIRGLSRLATAGLGFGAKKERQRVG